jgi:hypothetical protein
VREAFLEAQKAYQAMKSPENLELDIFKAGHVFDGRTAFPWIHKHWKTSV